MTHEELREQYEQALARADATRIAIVAVGEDLNGTALYFVPSASNPEGDWHRVWLSGGSFHCTCEAGARGRLCTHKAIVRRQVIEEGRDQQPPTVTATPTKISRPLSYDGRRKNNTCVGCGARFEIGEDLVLTDQGAYHHPTCLPTTATLQAAPGDKAVRRTGQAFSILK